MKAKGSNSAGSAPTQNEVRWAQLMGAAEALRGLLSYPPSLSDPSAHDRTVATLRAWLGEAAFAAAWEAGRGLSVDQAVAIALDEAPLPALPAVQHVDTRSRAPDDGRRPTPRADLAPAEWAVVFPLLPHAAGRRGRPFEDHRRVINGILWKLRTGAPWRDVPAWYGSWHTCHDRYLRWRRQGLWDQIEQALRRPPDPAGE